MNAEIILQIIIGDVVLSAIISAVFVVVSNRASNAEKEQLEKEMLFLKDILEQHFRAVESKIDALKELQKESGKTAETLNFLQLLKDAEKEPPHNGSSK
jgi:hypothetical protein